MRTMANVRQPAQRMIGRMIDAFRMREEPEREESEEMFENDTDFEASQSWDGVSQVRDRVSQTSEEASQDELWDGPTGSAAVPEMAASPLWWAKAARNVSWRGQRAARIAVCSGGAVAAALLAVTVGGIVAAVFGVAALTVFLVLDPIQLFCRRIAIQTRVLTAIGAWMAAYLIWRPSAPAAAALGIYAALAAVLIRLGNDQWVVEANYCSSSELYTAFRANPAESAHQALKTKENTIYTYWYEMGVPPKDPLSWALACGSFCLGWLAGKKAGKEEQYEEDGESGKNREIRELRKRCRELGRELEEKDAAIAELSEKVNSAERSAVASWDVTHEKSKATAELKANIEELERKLLEKKDDGYREKLLWYEYHGMGNRSVREISRNTGIPRSTVQRWIAKQKEEDVDREQISGDGPENGEERP